MAARAAIVTGGSSGIGLAIARVLGEEGYALTIASRRPERLQVAAAQLAADGYDVQQLAGDLRSEEVIKQLVAAHRERYGRLDVLVNNAGVGIGAPVQEIETKYLDMQLAVDLRSVVLFYRECAELLKAAGAEHHNALVVNMSSFAGKSGQAWLSVYSAVKHGVVGFTQAMNRELIGSGVKSCALCPAFVDTAMTDFIKESIPGEGMIRPEDVAEAMRMLLHLSPTCVVGEVVFQRSDELGRTDERL